MTRSVASMENTKVRVAIVGTGMAGLVTAHLLNQDPQKRYDITIFEKGSSLSLDSASVTLRDESNGAIERVDLPMRAIAGGYYQNTRSMYDFLGIRYRAQRFLFAFSEQPQQQNEEVANDDEALRPPYFIHASNLHQLPPRPPGMSRLEHVLRIGFVLVCYAWLSLCCFLIEPASDESFGQYVDRIWLPRSFVSRYAIPLMAGVSTCPHEQLLQFPASDIVNYKKLSHASEHYVVDDGVRMVQSKLVKGLAPRTNAQVLRVQPEGSRVRVTWQSTQDIDGGSTTESFDRVVLAVSPDVVGRIFEPLKTAMSKVPTIAVVNTILQRTGGGAKLRKVDSEFHETTPSIGAENAAPQLITLNSKYGPNPETEALHLVDCGAVVATCPFDVDDTDIILHRWDFPRVLRTTESRRVVNELMQGKGRSGDAHTREKPDWTNGVDSVWLAGGWCWDGMVLLEGCVTSAMRVADDFDVRVPWRAARKA